MSFEEHIRKGIVRRTSKNENLVRSLVKQTKEDMEFFEQLPLNEKSARKIVSNYYDFLRSIVEAMAAIDGYKIYGHELFSEYLAIKGESVLAKKFDRFREIRNRINYYGALISVQEAEEFVKDMQEIIALLTKKYLNKLL